MFIKEFNTDIEKIHYLKLDKEQLLLEALTEYTKKNNIKTAEISFIGAVQNVKVMYFNQIKKEYEHHEFHGGHEVLNGLGNVSLLDGEPFVHIHMTVADKEGKAFGGHLDEGTRVWLIEAIIKEINSKESIKRKLDNELCLNVWKD